jgi:hypothetical protein
LFGTALLIENLHARVVFLPVLLKNLVGKSDPKTWSLDFQPSGPDPSDVIICLAQKTEGNDRTAGIR